MTQLQPGEIVAGTYEVTGSPKGGGMGTVYPGRNIHMHTQIVAIKVLTGRPDEQAMIDRFKAEAELLMLVNHQHIPRFYTYAVHNGMHIIVMELIRGGTLSEAIYVRQVSERDLLEIWDQVADALWYLHTGLTQPLIHRDVKGLNILINWGAQIKATLVDLGVAKQSGHDQRMTKVGTANYAHPLQQGGAKPIPFFDIWGCGATFLEAAMPYDWEWEKRTAPFPFQENDGKRTVERMLAQSKVSTGMQRIIAKCLEYRQADSYRDVAEMRADIRHLLGKPQLTGNTSSGIIVNPPGGQQTQVTKVGTVSDEGGVWNPMKGNTTLADTEEDDLL